MFEPLRLLELPPSKGESSPLQEGVLNGALSFDGFALEGEKIPTGPFLTLSEMASDFPDGSGRLESAEGVGGLKFPLPLFSALFDFQGSDIDLISFNCPVEGFFLRVAPTYLWKAFVDFGTNRGRITCVVGH